MNPTPVPRNVRTAHTRRTARDRQRRPPRQSAPGCGCLVNLVAALLLVGAVVALLPLGVMAFEVAHDGRIYPGVSVGGVDVGGCKPEEARARVQKVYAGYAAEPLLLQYQDDSWPVTPAELGLRVDANPAIAAAFAVGRTPDLSASLQDQAQALTQGYAFDPHITLDAGVLTSALNEFAEQIDQPGGDAAIQMQGLQVTLKAGQSSRRLDLVRLADDLLAACQARSHGPITLVIDESAAALTPDQLAPAITSAGHILARPIVLTFPAPLPSDSGPAAVFTHTWALDQAALAEALWFPLERDATGQVMASARLHEEPLRNWVQGIADEVNQPVRNARLDLNPVRMTLSPIVTSQEGRTVDITATVTAIQIAALTDGERVVPLVVDITPPAVDMRDPAALGIR
ncbi:MAG: peptidoglycan binding domain-containing protein, partial [Chloroflexi bacterium]|nr:peptidoglycan binding domain-containing protein [Chloroflexota bacterium]